MTDIRLKRWSYAPTGFGRPAGACALAPSGRLPQARQRDRPPRRAGTRCSITASPAMTAAMRTVLLILKR
jgi:hypothetical protein